MDNVTPTFSQGVQSSGSRLLDGLRGLPYYDYSIKQPQSTAPSYGIPTQDLTNQIQEAAKAGHSISDVHSAIDEHPQITDKTGAKSFAQKIFEGIGNTAKTVVSDVGGALFPALGNHSENQKQSSYLEGFKQEFQQAKTVQEANDIMGRANKLLDKAGLGNLSQTYSDTIKKLK